MKKRYLMLALIVLISTLSVVSASENISVSNDLATDDSLLSVEEISPTDNSVIKENTTTVNEDSSSENDSSDSAVSDEGSVNSTAASNSTSDSVKNTTVAKKAKPYKVVTKNLSSTYGTRVYYTVKVLDKSGKPIVGQLVTVTIGDKSVSKNTSSEELQVFHATVRRENTQLYMLLVLYPVKIHMLLKTKSHFQF